MSHTCHEDPPSCPPCAYLTSISCPCGRIKQSLRCGVSVSSPVSSNTLKCNSQCEIVKRNARLAEQMVDQELRLFYLPYLPSAVPHWHFRQLEIQCQ
ncbi:hypothetical protein F5887DRAFT_968614 [Amanita rubescens]|nr:hypothetical protein F5887DRAFT_968614 [Amanita rubescens]